MTPSDRAFDGSDPQDRRPARPELRPGHGLCEICAHVRVVTSGRGSSFFLCRRSIDDPRFPKYPPQPVRVCPGFERAPG